MSTFFVVSYLILLAVLIASLLLLVKVKTMARRRQRLDEAKF